MAADVGSGSFWTTANQELCVEPASIAEKVPAFKPCSKKINGHAIFCQHMAAILPSDIEGIFDQRSAAFGQRDRVMLPMSKTDQRFRPPQVG
jgi:hypothetical protein